MKTKLTVLGALAAAALSLGATAQEWNLVAINSAQLTFAEQHGIKRNEIAASAWVLESFTAVNHTDPNWRPYRSRSVRYVFNCGERTYTIAESILHAGALGHGASGPPLRTEVPTFAAADTGSPAGGAARSGMRRCADAAGQALRRGREVGVQPLAPAPQWRGRPVLIQYSLFAGWRIDRFGAVAPHVAQRQLAVDQLADAECRALDSLMATVHHRQRDDHHRRAAGACRGCFGDLRDQLRAERCARHRAARQRGHGVLPRDARCIAARGTGRGTGRRQCPRWGARWPPHRDCPRLQARRWPRPRVARSWMRCRSSPSPAQESSALAAIVAARILRATPTVTAAKAAAG